MNLDKHKQTEIGSKCSQQSWKGQKIKKAASESLTFKVAHFPRGRWCQDGARAQDGCCHMPRNEEDAILLSTSPRVNEPCV